MIRLVSETYYERQIFFHDSFKVKCGNNGYEFMIHPHFRTECSKNIQTISVLMQTLKTHPFHYYCVLFVKSFALFSVIEIIMHMLA